MDDDMERRVRARQDELAANARADEEWTRSRAENIEYIARMCRDELASSGISSNVHVKDIYISVDGISSFEVSAPNSVTYRTSRPRSKSPIYGTAVESCRSLLRDDIADVIATGGLKPPDPRPPEHVPWFSIIVFGFIACWLLFGLRTCADFQ